MRHVLLLLYTLCFGVALFLPDMLYVLQPMVQTVFAETDVFVDGLVPEGRDADYSPDGYGSCEAVQMINNIIQFLIRMTALFAVTVFVYAGFLMVIARGDASLISKAKGLFANVLVGVVIMFSAFLIINTILSVLVDETSGVFRWQTVKCTYAEKPAPAEAFGVTLSYTDTDWVMVSRDDAVAGSGAGGGGSCTVVSNTSNECSVDKLSCFGERAREASQICNVESGGGNRYAVSATDLCMDGASFSGGLFQINILAHYNSIPGCSADFFQTDGNGPQGSCLRWKTSGGVRYCAVRNCRITNPDVYKACMRAVFDTDFNIAKACSLYSNRGDTFRDWAYTANKCNIN